MSADEQATITQLSQEKGVLVSREGIGSAARGLPRVLVTMGSDSDLPLMIKAIDTLRYEFGVT